MDGDDAASFPHVITWVTLSLYRPTFWYSPPKGKEASLPSTHQPGSSCGLLCCLLVLLCFSCSYCFRNQTLVIRWQEDWGNCPEQATLRFSGGWTVSDCDRACCCSAMSAAHLPCWPPHTPLLAAA